MEDGLVLRALLANYQPVTTERPLSVVETRRDHAAVISCSAGNGATNQAIDIT